ncbi:VOC family protein [Paenibacillus sp. FSL H8-0537]|uniref:VOC family protein n=1 Tax=Paenibacillus sp. FSL H8-0537 TaxID=2921399 RepID=UPI003100D456
MAKLTTYFFSEDAKAQADFYIQSLGGEIISMMKFGDLPDTQEDVKDRILHLEMKAAGVSFMLCDAVNQTLTHGNAINLSLEFEGEAEAHDAFNKLSEGGTVKKELSPEFWGSLFGQLEDKFGIQWMITTAAKTSAV